jgi:hypothetical protein
MINDNIDVHNGCQWNDGRVCKTYLKPGAKLVPIQMFGYWVYSVTVDEVDQLGWVARLWPIQGKFRVDPTQGVYKVKFPVTGRARKSRADYNGPYQFPQLETLPQQGTNCKESPLMNWWLRNGPRWRIGRTLFFQESNTGWPLPGETYSIRYRLQSQSILKWWKATNNILVEPIDTEQWI